MAVIKTYWSPSKFLPLKDQDEEVGEDIVAIGHPNGNLWNQSKGIVSNVELQGNPSLGDYYYYFLQHDVPTDEGSSGGPLINSKGQVVGIVTAYKFMLGHQGIVKIQETGKIAVKSSWTKKFLEKNGIKYSTKPIIAEGISEIEKQFYELRNLRELFLEEKNQFQQEVRRFELLKREFEIEREKFYREKGLFEAMKLEAQALLNQAEEIKQEKKKINNEWAAIYQKKDELEEKERWLNEKERSIRKKFNERFAFEIMFKPNYQYNLSQEFDFMNWELGSSLFYRFGFIRDYFGDIESNDQIGFMCSLGKYSKFPIKTITSNYSLNFGLSLEFSNLIRISLGKFFELHPFVENDKNMYFFNLQWNWTRTPFIVGLSASYFSNLDFDKKIVGIGLHFIFHFPFLKF